MTQGYEEWRRLERLTKLCKQREECKRWHLRQKDLEEAEERAQRAERLCEKFRTETSKQFLAQCAEDNVWYGAIRQGTQPTRSFFLVVNKLFYWSLWPGFNRVSPWCFQVLRLEDNNVKDQGAKALVASLGASAGQRQEGPLPGRFY